MSRQKIETLEDLAARASFVARDNILAYWLNNAIDEKNGGFYGEISKDNVPDSTSRRCIILNARILWAFSRAYGYYKEERYKVMADLAYNYILKKFFDQKNGGVYWMLQHNGEVHTTQKQSYAQAFTIYALSEYAYSCKKHEALDKAMDLFYLLEDKARDTVNGGYVEALSEDWEHISDVRLSSQDMNEKKSNNTHLHIMEAYTTLARYSENAAVNKALNEIVSVMCEKIYNPLTQSFILFFDEKWNARSRTLSFGHDIEAAWLLHDALDVLYSSNFPKSKLKLIEDIGCNALENYLDEDGAMNNEKNGAEIDRDKIWWVQAEACVGFLNSYELSGDRRYADAAIRIWNFIEEHLIDHKHGEWYWYAKNDGVTKKVYPNKADSWKCPYHNTRACLEIIERIGRIESLEENNEHYILQS